MGARYIADVYMFADSLIGRSMNTLVPLGLGCRV